MSSQDPNFNPFPESSLFLATCTLEQRVALACEVVKNISMGNSIPLTNHFWTNDKKPQLIGTIATSKLKELNAYAYWVTQHYGLINDGMKISVESLIKNETLALKIVDLNK